MEEVINLLKEAQEVLEDNCICGNCGPCQLAKKIKLVDKTLGILCPHCKFYFFQMTLENGRKVECPACKRELFTIYYPET